jgi:MFS family permease
MRAPGLGPILLTVFLDLLGFGLVIPLLGFYAEAFDATPGQVTTLMACYSLAQFLAAPSWGALSDRVGRRPVLLATVALGTLCLVGFAQATSLWQLFVFRTLHGLAAANIGTAQAYVADVTTGPDRAKGMGLVGAAFGVGFSVGPWLGGELSAVSLSAPIWVAAAFGLVNLVWMAFALPESRPGTPTSSVARSRDPRALFRALGHPVVGHAIALAFLGTFAFAMVESTFQLVAEHVWSYDAPTVGRLFGVIGVVGIVVQGGLLRRLVPRYGEARLLRWGYAINAVGVTILATASPGVPVVAGAGVMALGTSLIGPNLNALLSRATSADEQGWVLGTSQSFASLARALAPLLGGWSYTALGPRGPMGVGALLLLAAWAWSGPAATVAEAGRRG